MMNRYALMSAALAAAIAIGACAPYQNQPTGLSRVVVSATQKPSNTRIVEGHLDNIVQINGSMILTVFDERTQALQEIVYARDESLNYRWQEKGFPKIPCNSYVRIPLISGKPTALPDQPFQPYLGSTGLQSNNSLGYWRVLDAKGQKGPTCQENRQ